nr:cystatin-like fold lipoprotein [Bacillus velezensis]
MMKQEKKVRKEMRADSDEYKRDNAIIRVYDDGKYIQLAFYQPEESSRKLTA